MRLVVEDDNYMKEGETAKDYYAWTYLLWKTLIIQITEGIHFENYLAYLRYCGLRITRAGKFDFSEVNFKENTPCSKEEILMIRRDLYETYGDRLVELLKRAAQLVRE